MFGAVLLGQVTPLIIISGMAVLVLFIGWLIHGLVTNWSAQTASSKPLTVPVQPLPVVTPIAESSKSVPVSSEAAALARITAQTQSLNFDRIGHATATEADDLKDIAGIGPLLERKLHSLGVYTFRQISQLAPEDVIQLNTIIEFLPGRIDRDDWTGQARRLHERKHGRPGNPEIH